MKAYTLVGVDGKAFAVLGYVTKAMEKAKFSREEIDKYLNEAKSDDYGYLLATSMEYIDKVNERLGLTEDEDIDE